MLRTNIRALLLFLALALCLSLAAAAAFADEVETVEPLHSYALREPLSKRGDGSPVAFDPARLLAVDGGALTWSALTDEARWRWRVYDEASDAYTDMPDSLLPTDPGRYQLVIQEYRLCEDGGGASDTEPFEHDRPGDNNVGFGDEPIYIWQDAACFPFVILEPDFAGCILGFVPGEEALWRDESGEALPLSCLLDAGEDFRFPAALPSCAGRVFIGWATESGAALPAYQPGAVMTPAGDARFYAVWVDLSQPDGVLPAALQALEDEALAGCSFRYLRLPEGLSTLGARAFVDSARLYAIYLPASLETVAADAFAALPEGATLISSDTRFVSCTADSALRFFAIAES